MIIGINAAAAIKQPRTGVEEYTYQLIKHLTMLPEARAHRFLLYLPSVAPAKAGMFDNKENPSTSPPAGGSAQGILPEQVSSVSRSASKANIFDFPLPPNFEIKILRWPLPFLWTQIRLAWEILVRPPEALFIPVHVLPLFARLDSLSRRGWAPKNSVVTIHGLEYEYWPQGYSSWRRWYLRWSTKSAVKRAQKIIAISENTKQDLIKLYGVEAEKISVVYHGVGSKIFNDQISISNKILNSNDQAEEPYLLYVGRIETKKNIQGILEAYKILKEKYHVPHELVLAGSPGYGYEALRRALRACSGNNVRELGYVSEEEKWRLLSNTEAFLFPSFYEGFGIPVLEAQTMGVPVVTSLGSCLPEVAGQGALFVDPHSPTELAKAIKQIIDDNNLRDRLRQSGFENIKRFSWEKCAKETLKTIIATFLAAEK
jgi:glycosyltransferase involved in cell wall biosynthesis